MANSKNTTAAKKAATKQAAQKAASVKCQLPDFVEKCIIDTVTTYEESGSMLITPAPYEADKDPITRGGKIVSNRGRMTVLSNGAAHFSPYQKTNRKVYRRRFVTRHGELRVTNSDVIISFHFPQRMKNGEMRRLYYKESAEMREFIRTVQTPNDWRR